MAGVFDRVLYRLGGVVGSLADPYATVKANLIHKQEFESAFHAFDTFDLERAFTLFLARAEGGDPEAQHNVGILYETGSGTHRDDAAAEHWYRKAALQSLPEAQYQLAAILAGDPMAARNTKMHPNAQERLTQAYAWLILANRSKHRAASTALRRLGKRLPSHQRNDAEELARVVSSNETPCSLQSNLISQPVPLTERALVVEKQMPATFWTIVAEKFEHNFLGCFAIGFLHFALRHAHLNDLSFLETITALMDNWTLASVIASAVALAVILSGVIAVAAATYETFPGFFRRGLIFVFATLVVVMFAIVVFGLTMKLFS